MSASLSSSYNVVESADSRPLSASSSSSSSTTDSLPSSSDSALDSELEEGESDSLAGEESDAEREWKESLQQLELLLTMVLVPFVGKYLGRRCAYWGEWLCGPLSGLFLFLDWGGLGEIRGIEEG